MAIMSFSLSVIGLPVLLLIATPIAILAWLTTTFAVVVLLTRAILVHVEMGLALIPSMLFSRKSAPRATISRIPSFRTSTSISNFQISNVRRRHRKTSSSSSSSHGSKESITPTRAHPSSSLELGLPQSIGPQRDFEGVGGWRLSHTTEEDDALWTRINMRLDLPADATQVRRHHNRALTSSGMSQNVKWRRRCDMSYSPESITTSPNMSRARTPPVVMAYAPPSEGYFSQPASPYPGKRMGSMMTASTGNLRGSGLTMKQYF